MTPLTPLPAISVLDATSSSSGAKPTYLFDVPDIEDEVAPTFADCGLFKVLL
jgi:hypothetical protein